MGRAAGLVRLCRHTWAQWPDRGGGPLHQFGHEVARSRPSVAWRAIRRVLGPGNRDPGSRGGDRRFGLAEHARRKGHARGCGGACRGPLGACMHWSSGCLEREAAGIIGHGLLHGDVWDCRGHQPSSRALPSMNTAINTVMFVGLGIALASVGVAMVAYLQTRQVRKAERAIQTRVKLRAGDSMQLYARVNEGPEQRIQLVATREIPYSIVDEAVGIILA